MIWRWLWARGVYYGLWWWWWCCLVLQMTMNLWSCYYLKHHQFTNFFYTTTSSLWWLSSSLLCCCIAVYITLKFSIFFFFYNISLIHSYASEMTLFLFPRKNKKYKEATQMGVCELYGVFCSFKGQTNQSCLKINDSIIVSSTSFYINLKFCKNIKFVSTQLAARLLEYIF